MHDCIAHGWYHKSQLIGVISSAIVISVAFAVVKVRLRVVIIRTVCAFVVVVLEGVVLVDGKHVFVLVGRLLVFRVGFEFQALARLGGRCRSAASYDGMQFGWE